MFLFIQQKVDWEYPGKESEIGELKGAPDQNNALIDAKKKEIRYRCVLTKGLNTTLTEEEAINVQNWIVECRKNLSQYQQKVWFVLQEALIEHLKKKNSK